MKARDAGKPRGNKAERQIQYYTLEETECTEESWRNGKWVSSKCFTVPTQLKLSDKTSFTQTETRFTALQQPGSISAQCNRQDVVKTSFILTRDQIIHLK